MALSARVWWLVMAGGLALSAPLVAVGVNEAGHDEGAADSGSWAVAVPAPAPLCSAQEPVDDEVADALRTLKARKLSWDQKVDAMDTLLASGPKACSELAKHLAKNCTSMDASFQKEWTRLLEDFENAAAKVANAQLDKAALKRLEGLRKTWLKTSRSKDLSKSQVKEICDKAHDEVKEILDINQTQVWDAEPKLEKRWDQLVLELDDLLLVHDYLIGAREELAKDSKTWGGKSYMKKTPPDPRNYEEHAFFMLDRAVRLATVMQEKDRKVILANEADFAELDPEEVAGIIDLNRIRVRAGLSALRVDLKLCDAGRGHSQDMVEHDFFAHESPVPGKKSPSDRAAKAGTSGGAENIAFGQQTGLGAIQAWWYSPGHHRNMMGNHSRVGLGRFKSHWTQMFG